MGGILESLGWGDVNLHYRWLERRVPAFQSGVNYEAQCAKEGREYYAKNVLFGHTHEPKSSIYNYIKVVNCGSWTNGRTDFAELDEVGGNWKLEEW